MINIIGNCRGCQEEWNMACDYVKQGYHVATTKNNGNENIGVKGHYIVMIVNDEGKLIIS